MAVRSDLYDLAPLRLRAGEGRTIELEVRVDPFELSAERYDVAPSPVPELAHVSAVFVRPDRWRRGIARALLDEAEAAMVEHGYERAQLWTLEGSPAERLYTALGWERDGRRDVFAPMGGLAIVAYVKALPSGPAESVTRS